MTNENTKKLFERLSKTVIPIHYDLTIQPFLDTFKFNGNVIIHIQVKELVDTVILYAVELEIDDAKLTSNSKEELKGKIEIDKENERVKINFDRRIEKGDYQLSLQFTGDINERLQGFYRNKYTTIDGKEVRYGATTQFEPADCRRAFPCWDEPNFKATFDVTLITLKNLQAISNMPIKSENEWADDKQWKITKFDRTPIC